MDSPIIVTGAAGFIGMHLSRRLLGEGRRVVGIDNLNDYYDPQLKRARLATLAGFDGFAFHEIDVSDRAAVDAVFDRNRPREVVHLAAQAGVRYALTNPMAYS
ncbi:MAG TPA: GDP-mannose 4,6-dehydratase, partial [Burkholderiaceae bacterium]|nr:GDP-mannose 4,6-dehydratase [Burkholderiaceae bacterium]